MTIRLLGGEMLRWSDTGGGARPAGGDVFEELLRRVASGRVLLAGHHSPQLLDVLLASCDQVTCLVRSLPDATDLEAAHPEVEIVAGGLDRFPEEHTYDLVVALDGISRLITPESGEPSWSQCLGLFSRLLRPEGRLVVAVENALGSHRLTKLVPKARGPVQRWRPDDAPTRPASPDELELALRDNGLCPDHLYSGYPTPEQPSALLGRRAALMTGGLPVDLIAAAARSGTDDLIADPGPLVTDAFRAGLGAALATVWVAVARMPAAAPTGDLPDILLCEPGDDPRWTVPVELTGAANGWNRGVCRDSAVISDGRVLREPGRLAQPLPQGRLLHELLTDSIFTFDLPRARELLRAYAGWLTSPFAVPENVVVEGNTFALVDASWSLTEPETSAVALARVLRHFAADLVGAGRQLPWPAGMTVHQVTELLQVMAGHAADHRLLQQGVRLEAEIVGTRQGLRPGQRSQLLTAINRGDAALVRRLPYRELLAAHAEISSERAGLVARYQWAERQLRKVEQDLEKSQKALKRQQLKIEGLRGSVTFKTGRLVTGPGRALAQLARPRTSDVARSDG